MKYCISPFLALATNVLIALTNAKNDEKQGPFCSSKYAPRRCDRTCDRIAWAPSRSHLHRRSCTVGRLRYAFAFFDASMRTSTSTAITMSTTPSASEIQGLFVKPAMT